MGPGAGGAHSSGGKTGAAAGLQGSPIAGAKPLQIPPVQFVEDGDVSRGSDVGQVTPAAQSTHSSGCPPTPSTPTASK
jgi:hypothetical protein